MSTVIIDITLANEEALGMLKDYLEDNNLSYEVKEVKETPSLVGPALKVGDIVTIIGNKPTITTGMHFLELGEVCKVVKTYCPITGVVEVSPLGEEGYTQMVYPDDIERASRKMVRNSRRKNRK